MRTARRHVVTLLLGISGVVGCGAIPPWGGGMTAADTELEAEYAIHANDQLEISVWGQEDLGRTVRVRADGTITFPLVGDVTAQEHTPRELEHLLAQKLAEGYLNDPSVSVRVVGQRFSVLGEVEKPGTYPLEGRVDVLAALSMAGGINKFGGSSLEIIRVQANGQKVRYRVDTNEILSGRRPAILIHPHDTLHVRRRAF